MRADCVVCLVLTLVLGGCAAPTEPLPSAEPSTPEPLVASTTSSSTTSTSTTVPPAASTTTSTSSTTTSTNPESVLVLRADGLGVVSFGDPMEDVIIALTNALGERSSDLVMQAPFDSGYEGIDRGPMACNTATGYACFEYLRWMSWKEAGVGVTFLDVRKDPAAEVGDEGYFQVPPNLQGYDYWGADGDPLAHTIDGITIGSTVADLIRVHGDAVKFAFGCGEVPECTVDDPESADGGGFRCTLSFDEPYEWETLDSGYVDPASLDPNTTIRSIAAGAQSSC